MNNVTIISLFVVAIILAAMAFVIASFGMMAMWGAPFVGTPKPIVRRMLILAGAKPGETLMDLGSGAGSILIVAAKEFGMKAIGYELNPFLRWITKFQAWRYGVSDRVEVRSNNVFSIVLPSVDIVTLFLLPAMVARLKPALQKSLTDQTRVIARDFHFQDWPHFAEDGWLRAYRKEDVL